jgi:phosphoglycerate dehydrogenase-like enzyme
MDIMFTHSCPQNLKEEIQRDFPHITFHFVKPITDGWDILPKIKVLVTYGEDITKEIIHQASSLQWIMVMSAGVEKLPFDLIAEKKILVTNARGIHAIPMAEYALGMMLNYVKQFTVMHHQQQEQTWNRRLPFGELADQTLLVIGTGAIGQEIARLAKAFRMNVLGVNRSGQAVPHVDECYPIDYLLHVLPTADFIVSVLPSTNETKYLLKREHFQAMKSSACFMNIGRGDLIASHVLYEALTTGEISHAVLDVFEEEPLLEDHPFWRMENVTITPHISSISQRYLPRAFEIFKHNLHSYTNNRENYLNVIDVMRGY